MAHHPGIDVGGGTVQIDPESSFGVASGAAVFIRVSEGTTINETATRKIANQPNMGSAATGLNRQDDPTPFEAYTPAAFKLVVELRRNAANGAQPPLMTLLEAGGFSVLGTSGDSAIATAGYTDTGTWTMDDDLYGGADYFGGIGQLVELSTGFYFPTLLGEYDFATKVCDAAMKLPSASADAKAIEQLYMARPRVRAIPAAKTLTVYINTRGKHTTAPDYQMVFSGCILESIDNFIIEPGQPIRMGLTFGAADIARASDTLAAETFADGERRRIADGNLVHMNVNTAAPPIDLTFTSEEMHKAEIDFKHRVVVTPGIGGTSSVNGAEGALCYVADSGADYPTITITGAFDNTHMATLEGADAQTEKFIGFAHPSTSLSDPIWAFYAPRCKLLGYTGEFFGDMIIGSRTYGMTSAQLGTARTIDQEEMAPFYFGLSNETT